MRLLEQAEYRAAAPLLPALDIHLTVQAVISGAIPGDVYVDSPAAPATLVVRAGHLVYPAGAINEETSAFLAELITQQVVPFARTKGPGAYLVKPGTSDWLDLAQACCPADMEGVRAERHRFEHTGDAPVAPLPEDFRLVEIEPSLLSAGIEGIGALSEEMLSERPSVEEFLAHSFGIAALHGNRFAGWCTSEYNTGDRCEVGIGTEEPYRRRGLAAAMGAAFIELAHSRGVRRIGWHCFARNEGSVATALRLGYQKTADYSAWIAWVKEG